MMTQDFGKLWIDTPKTYRAGQRLIPPHLTEHFDNFVNEGYTVFKQAISEDLVDQILRDKDLIYKNPEQFVFKRAGKYADAKKLDMLKMGDRIIDLYAVSEASRKAIACPIVADFLNLLFRETPTAIQSLYFEYGSQQAMHQDTAYVVLEKPLSLAACWIALEDIYEGSGELVFYPGSHRFDHFLFSGEFKHWMISRDGKEQHQDFLKNLHRQAQNHNIQKKSFLAKKGDILIWHADLAHGGDKIQLQNQTRKSLVAHYCPLSIKANYAKFTSETYAHYHYKDNFAFTCRHYDLQPLIQGKDRAEPTFKG